MNNGKDQAFIYLWLLAAIVWCVMEGAFRKWGGFNAGLSQAVLYGGKDLILVLLSVRGFSRQETRFEIWNYVNKIVVPCSVLITLGALLSALNGFSVVGAALTIRNLLVYPIAVVLLARMLEMRAFTYVMFLIWILAIPSAFLGVVQFYSPQGAYINKLIAEDSQGIDARLDGRVRASGTFSYIGGYGIFGLVSVWAGIVGVIRANNKALRILAIAGLLSALVMILVTVSRGWAIGAGVLMISWLIFYESKGKLLIGVGVVVLTIVALFDYIGGVDGLMQVASAPMTRHAQTNETLASRLNYHFTDAVTNGIVIAPFGQGLGISQRAEKVISALSNQNAVIESAWGRLILEVGVLGFTGSLILVAGAIGTVWSRASMLPRDSYVSCARISVVLMLLLAFRGIYFNHVSAFFFWIVFMVTIVMLTERRSMLESRTCSEDEILASGS